MYKGKYQGALNQKDSIEIIILGNSHATYGVDPSPFKMYAYNLANVNQSLYFDKRIAIKLIPYLKNLKYVLISIDYHSLYFSSQGIRDKWSYLGNGIAYKNNNFILEKVSPTLFAYTPKAAFSLVKRRILNLLKYGNDIIDFDVPNGINLKDPFVKGFISYDEVDKSALTKERIKTDTHYYNEVIEKSNEKDTILADLSNFIEILQKKEITPILFTSPTYLKYNKYLKKSHQIDNAKTIEALCKKYHIKYWDFMNSNLFQKDDYFDDDHLNKFGANKFGKMLNDSINKIKAQL